MMNVYLSVEPVKYPLTGIGRYTHELANNLSNIDDDLDLKLISAGRIVGIDHLNSLASHRFENSESLAKIKAVIQKSSTIVSLRRRVVSYLDTRVFPKNKDFVYHSPNFYINPFVDRQVVTIHDLSAFTWSQCHPSGRAKVIRDQIEAAIQKAALIFTISEFSRSEILTHFAIAENRVVVTPLGPSGIFSAAHPENVDDVLLRYGLNKNKYVLYCGTIEPRKNIAKLLQAYNNLPNKIKFEYPLILTGYYGWSTNELHDQIRQFSQEGWLKYLGYAPEAFLPSLYAGARLFVFPSLYEGFGLPVIEAMAMGLPVICSDIGALMEVTNGTALTFDPYDITSISKAIIQGVEDSSWRDRAKIEGIERSKYFTWLECSKKTLLGYKIAYDM